MLIPAMSREFPGTWEPATAVISAVSEANLFHPAFIIVCLLALMLAVLLALRMVGRRKRLSGERREVDRKVAERTREIQNTNRELEKRQAFSRMLSEISTRFITLPPSRIDEEIPVALGRVAQAINAQRAHIYMPNRQRMDGEKVFVEVAYEWHRSDIGPVETPVRRIDPERFPWIRAQYERGDPTVVLDPATLPPEAQAEREFYEEMRWTSVAIIPLFVEKRFVGNLNFTTRGEALTWLPILVSELRVVGEIFANALERNRQNEMMIALRQDAQDAEERERTRISRELHDQLGGALTALKMQAKKLQRKLSSEQSELAADARRITEIIDHTLPDVRRICTELRPAILDELELPDALEWQADQFTKRTGIPCEFDLFLEGSLNPQHNRDVALFRIVQELLTNVMRHAKATRVRVSLTQETEDSGTDSHLLLTVSDNGIGFDPDEAGRKPDRFGLRGVRERAQHLGGELRLARGEDGGALVTVRIPECNGHHS